MDRSDAMTAGDSHCGILSPYDFANSKSARRLLAVDIGDPVLERESPATTRPSARTPYCSKLDHAPLSNHAGRINQELSEFETSRNCPDANHFLSAQPIGIERHDGDTLWPKLVGRLSMVCDSDCSV